MEIEVEGTEKRVCEDIAARQKFGKEKYGTTVEENPLSHREWLQHAYEEALDFAIYLRRAKEEVLALELDLADLKEEQRELDAQLKAGQIPKFVDECKPEKESKRSQSEVKGDPFSNPNVDEKGNPIMTKKLS
jgi:hypothetical protein